MLVKELSGNVFPKRFVSRETKTKSIPIAVLVNAVEAWDEWTMPIWWSYSRTDEHKRAVAEHKARCRR